MPIVNIANLKKTIYYLRRNGLQSTWNAARERLEQAKTQPYSWQQPSTLEWKAGRDACRELLENLEKEGKKAPTFSILVPAYRTDPVFLRELVESVKAQTYPCWEMLILDASGDSMVLDCLKDLCIVKGIPFSLEQMSSPADRGFSPGWIRYVSLPGNGGISENTNAGLDLACGEYIGLLDHDDVLTIDALHCMAEAILENREKIGELGIPGGSPALSVKFLYCDEDKWNGEAQGYFEPNFKEDFNLDLLLSNNYICHFLVMEAGLLRRLRLRKEYDGAQDYDLVLRAAGSILEELDRLREEGRISAEAARLLEPVSMVHIPRVLYHWRCHSASTAENPASKSYAYEAGRRALQDFAAARGIRARAEHLKHVGLYRLEYGVNGDERKGDVTGRVDPAQILAQRPDLGAVGGKLVCGSRKSARENRLPLGSVMGGRLDEEGNVYYKGLKPGYSGYLHRAVLTQDAEAVDLRCICVAKEYYGLFREIVGVPYVEDPETGRFDDRTLPDAGEVADLSLKLCQALTGRGKRILWDPEIIRRL